MPAGELKVGTAKLTSGPIPRDGFSSGKYELVYYPQQDLIDLGIVIELYGRT